MNSIKYWLWFRENLKDRDLCIWYLTWVYRYGENISMTFWLRCRFLFSLFVLRFLCILVPLYNTSMKWRCYKREKKLGRAGISCFRCFRPPSLQKWKKTTRSRGAATKVGRVHRHIPTVSAMRAVIWVFKVKKDRFGGAGGGLCRAVSVNTFS